jgi:hypothetical protein
MMIVARNSIVNETNSLKYCPICFNNYSTDEVLTCRYGHTSCCGYCLSYSNNLNNCSICRIKIIEDLAPIVERPWEDGEEPIHLWIARAKRILINREIGDFLIATRDNPIADNRIDKAAYIYTIEFSSNRKKIILRRIAWLEFEVHRNVFSIYDYPSERILNQYSKNKHTTSLEKAVDINYQTETDEDIQLNGWYFNGIDAATTAIKKVRAIHLTGEIDEYMINLLQEYPFV